MQPIHDCPVAARYARTRDDPDQAPLERHTLQAPLDHRHHWGEGRRTRCGCPRWGGERQPGLGGLSGRAWTPFPSPRGASLRHHPHTRASLTVFFLD